MMLADKRYGLSVNLIATKVMKTFLRAGGGGGGGGGVLKGKLGGRSWGGLGPML
jgi:hypothetical protein